MKVETFLITTSIGNRSRRFVWHGDQTTPLDHPARWVIERSGGSVWVRDASTIDEPPVRGPLQFALPTELPEGGVHLALSTNQEAGGSEPGRRLR